MGKKTIKNQAENDSSISIEDLKSVEFFSQANGAFYATKTELDKSLLSLSVAGIGFTATFSNVFSEHNNIVFSFFGISSLCFLITIFCVLRIFHMNGEYIVSLLGNDCCEQKLLEYKLKKLDTVSKYSFFIGVVSALALSVASYFS